jgi:hypothetical protein
MLLEYLPAQMQSGCILKNYRGYFRTDSEEYELALKICGRSARRQNKCAEHTVKITPTRKLTQIQTDMVTVAPAAFGGDVEAAWMFLMLTHRETLTRRMGLSSFNPVKQLRKAKS